MKSFSVVLVSLLAFAACGKGGGGAATGSGSAAGSASGSGSAAGSGSGSGSAAAPTESGPMAEAAAKMGEFKDQMCACKDTACATKVNDGFTNWSTDMAKKMDGAKDMKPSEALTKKMTDTAMAYGECMTKVMAPAGAGSAETGTMKAGGGTMDPKRAAEVVAKIKDMKTKMCACKDKVCADKVNDEFTKWATEQAAGPGKDDKPDDATMKTVTDDSMAYGECMTKAMGEK